MYIISICMYHSLSTLSFDADFLELVSTDKSLVLQESHEGLL